MGVSDAQLLNEKPFVPNKENAFCKKSVSYKSLAVQYLGPVLPVYTRTHSVLNRSDLEVTSSVSCSHETPWSKKPPPFCHPQHGANITAHEALVIEAGKRWCQFPSLRDFMLSDLHETLLTEHPAALVRNLRQLQLGIRSGNSSTEV